MSVKQTVNWLNQQRVDIPDLRSIESGVIFDFKTMIQSFAGNIPYILNGYTIPVSGISGPATSLQLVVDGAMVWVPNDGNGSFLRTETGTSNETLSPANPKVVGSFSPGANYVSVRFKRQTDATTNDLVSTWDVDSETEFTITAPRGLVMNYEIVIDGSTFGNNAPIAIINVSGSNVTSIKNTKQSPFRLGTGGATPDISYSHSYTVDPENNLLATTNSSPDPFAGGDWELKTFKDWMDAVMTELKLIKGSAFWYGLGSTITNVNLTNTFWDTSGSKITGSGIFRHSSVTPGELTWTSDFNIRSIFGRLSLLVTANTVSLGDADIAYITLVRNEDFHSANVFTFTNSSPTITATLAITGIIAGDWIKYEAHNLIAWAQVLTVVGSTITLTSNYLGAAAVGKALRTQGTYAASVSTPDTIPVDGNTYWIAKRDDNAFTTKTIANAATSGLQRSNDISTVKTTTSHNLVDGQAISIAGASDSSFNGFFDVLSILSATEFTILNPGANVGSATAGDGSITATPKIYLRLGGGSGELEQGEEAQIDDQTTLNILRFIGAESETDTTPPYTIFPNVLSPFSFTSNSNLTQAISKITGNVNDIFTTLDYPSYDEPLRVVSGAPADDNEVTGPILSGATLTLPLHSRRSDIVQNYIVSKGYLEVFLNGQLLQLTPAPYSVPLGWTEVGAALSASNQIVINQDLFVGDVITFRIDGPGGPGSGTGAPDDDFNTLASSVTADNADQVLIYDVSASGYRKQTRSILLSGLGGNLYVNTYSANQTLDASTDDVVLVDTSGGNVTITLPLAATRTRPYYIKKISADGNQMIIDGNGAEPIDNALTVFTTTQYESFTPVSDTSTNTWWLV